MADYTAPRYWAVRYFAVRYWSGSATPGGPQYVDAAFDATSASLMVASAVVDGGVGATDNILQLAAYRRRAAAVQHLRRRREDEELVAILA